MAKGKGKGGKILRDQVRKQQELEQQGFKNLILRNGDKILIDEKTGKKTIKYSNEKYCKIYRNNGSKRYEGYTEEAPGKPFTKNKVRKMGRLNHKNHRQKINVGDLVLIYVDKNDKPDKDGFCGGEIFHKYSEREAIELINRGEISDNLWSQTKVDNDGDDFIPFYFENEEVKTKEELKKEKQEKQAGEAYFNYDFDSDEDSDSIEEEQKTISKQSDESEQKEPEVNFEDI